MIGRVAKIYLGLVLVFLYLPIVVMIAMAFNRSPLYEMPFTFDLVWFKALAHNERLLQASWNSVWIACINTVIATTLGTLAAYAFARYEFRAKRLLQILLFPPITIPWLIIGTSMLIFFFWTGIGRGLHAILLGHVALSLPYVIVVVGARFANFGPELEEAAASLGATPWQSFWRCRRSPRLRRSLCLRQFRWRSADARVDCRGGWRALHGSCAPHGR